MILFHFVCVCVGACENGEKEKRKFIESVQWNFNTNSPIIWNVSVYRREISRTFLLMPLSVLRWHTQVFNISN